MKPSAEPAQVQEPLGIQGSAKIQGSARSRSLPRSKSLPQPRNAAASFADFCSSHSSHSFSSFASSSLTGISSRLVASLNCLRKAQIKSSKWITHFTFHSDCGYTPQTSSPKPKYNRLKILHTFGEGGYLSVSQI